MTYYVGVDIGQAEDPTAIAVLKQSSRQPMVDALDQSTVRGIGSILEDDRPPRIEYDVVHLERLALGTPYPRVVEYVGKMVHSPAVMADHVLVVDQTGVGRAVVDMLDEARLYPVAVTITAGDAVASATDGPGQPPRWDRLRVPKRDLVAVVQVLLQSGRLRIVPKLKDAQVLVKELREFRVKVSAAGRDTYGAWREGEHDDLVLAVSLACWYGERQGASVGQTMQRNVAAWETLGKKKRALMGVG